MTRVLTSFGYWVNLKTTFNLSNIPETSQENMNNDYWQWCFTKWQASNSTGKRIIINWVHKPYLRSYFKKSFLYSLNSGKPWKRSNENPIRIQERKMRIRIWKIYFAEIRSGVSREPGSVSPQFFLPNFRCPDWFSPISKVLMCQSKLDSQESAKGWFLSKMLIWA